MYFRCCQSDNNVIQTAVVPIIWDELTHMWRYNNVREVSKMVQMCCMGLIKGRITTLDVEECRVQPRWKIICSVDIMHISWLDSCTSGGENRYSVKKFVGAN